MVSGITRGLSQEGQSLAEGGPLVKTQKKVRNDSESLDVVDVHTSWKKENIPKNAKNNKLKNTK